MDGRLKSSFIQRNSGHKGIGLILDAKSSNASRFSAFRHETSFQRDASETRQPSADLAGPHLLPVDGVQDAVKVVGASAGPAEPGQVRSEAEVCPRPALGPLLLFLHRHQVQGKGNIGSDNIQTNVFRNVVLEKGTFLA